MTTPPIQSVSVPLQPIVPADNASLEPLPESSSGTRFSLDRLQQAQSAPEPPAATLALDGDVFDQFSTLMSRVQELRGRWDAIHADIAAGKVTAADPSVQHLERELMSEMLAVQVLANRAAFGVELMSKVVEHGTTSMRTVLQTQM